MQIKIFIASKLVFAKLIHPDDVATLKAEILFALHQKKTNLRLEYRLISKTKGIFWISDVLEMLRDSPGNTSHYQGVITVLITVKKLRKK